MAIDAFLLLGQTWRKKATLPLADVKVVVVGKQRASVSGHSATVAADTGARETSYCALNLCDISLQCPVPVDWRSRSLRMEWTAGRAPKRVQGLV
jgi:hypothetical protein